MKSTRKLAVCAVMCAISVVFTRLLSFQFPIAGLPVIRIGFGSIPIIIAGIVCGPLWGGVVGAVADLFGCLLNLMGTAFFPGFTLSAALTGVIPAVALRYCLRPHLSRRRGIPTLCVCASVVINEILVSFALNTTWLCILYGQGWIVLGMPRIISVVCMMLINSLFTSIILRALVHLPIAELYNPYTVRNAHH